MGKMASSAAAAAERGNRTPSNATEEERGHPQLPVSGGRKGGGGGGEVDGEPVVRVNGVGKRGAPSATPVATKRRKLTRINRTHHVANKPPSLDMEEEEEDEGEKNCTSDSKSETSDCEPPPAMACLPVRAGGKGREGRGGREVREGGREAGRVELISKASCCVNCWQRLCIQVLHS